MSADRRQEPRHATILRTFRSIEQTLDMMSKVVNSDDTIGKVAVDEDDDHSKHVSDDTHSHAAEDEVHAAGTGTGSREVTARKRTIDESQLDQDDLGKLENRRAYNRQCAAKGELSYLVLASVDGSHILLFVKEVENSLCIVVSYMQLESVRKNW